MAKSSRAIERMELGYEVWQSDNLMIAAVEIISDAMTTTNPLTRKALIASIMDECYEEPRTFTIVLQMLQSIWNGIQFEE